MKVFTLAAGLATGYVLGTRAGREKYDQIVAGYEKLTGHPTVVQGKEKAKQALNSGASSAISAADPTTPESRSQSDTAKSDTAKKSDPVTTSDPVVGTDPVVEAVVVETAVVEPVAPATPRPPRRKPTPTTPAVLTDPID